MREDPLAGALVRRGPQEQQVVHLRISDQGQLLTLRPPPDTDAGGPASSMHSGLPPSPLPQLLVNDQHQQDPLGIRSPHPRAPPGNRRLLGHRLGSQKGSSPLRRVSGIHQQVQCTGAEKIPLSPRDRTCRTQPGGTEAQGGQSVGPSQLLEVSE